MRISDSIFALPFGKIKVYGLIRLDFVVWALNSYNLPFSQFQKNKGISESILALPPGINCMGSAHICIGFKSELYDACFVLYSHRFVICMVRENYRV
jgi:hypothetical protein